MFLRRRRKKIEKTEEMLKESQDSLKAAEEKHTEQKRLHQQEHEAVTSRLERLARDSGNHLAMEFLDAFTERKRGEN